METHKYCQSCGMPLKKDPNHGGSNEDGSLNTMYCSYCYENGAFTQPDITVDEMKLLVVNQLKKMKFPGIIARYFASGIPKLERWKNVPETINP